MKIGVLLDNEFTIDLRVSNEVHYLKSIGYEIHVLCPNFGDHKNFELLDGISIHRFSLNKVIKNKLFGIMNTLPLYELFWIRKTKEFVRKVQPHYLHAHDLYMAKIAYLGGRKIIPLILDLHENYPEAFKTYKWVTRFPYNIVSKPKAWENKEKKYLAYASRIIVLSRHFKNQLINKYPGIKSDHIFVYPNVPDVKKLLSYPIATNLYPKLDRFILFYFGGISERRGIFTCFEAIKLLADKIPDIHLLLIGPVDGHEQAVFKNYLNDPIISNKITHYSWKDISEFPSYVFSSDVCLSPIYKNKQHESGVANKIFQYMLFGKPLIVSDCIPQVDLVESENCGLVYKSGNAEDLSHQILKLFSNRSLAEQMGMNGRQAVLNTYNLINCGEQLKLLYTSLLKSTSNEQ